MKGTNGKHYHLVFLLELEDLWQVHESSLHAVQTLDNQQDLLPRTVSLWLSLANDLPQQTFQALHVVMFEHSDAGTA